MCGRFSFNIPPELLAEIFDLPESPSISPRFNIAPTQLVPVIRQLPDGRNHLDLLRWGLIPSWAKDPSIGSKMINARSETITEKPAFRQAIKYRRCLVLGSGFYEWKKKGTVKQPWYIRLKDGAPMVLAGIWEIWKSPEGEAIESCSILTTAANRLVAPLHDRMPVILSPDEFDDWIDREITNPAALERLFQSYPADLMEMWPVSPLVNKVANDTADLILSLSNAPFLCFDPHDEHTD